MISREEYCVLACAEAFRGDGEIMVSPMGPVPKRAALLARATFAPDILLTDGVASLVADEGLEGWMPYRRVFETLWAGQRHVMMGATQIDQFGNTNISCIGDWAKPKVQLLGVRGGPGNTINHTTSYFVPRHSEKVFVPRVDVVSGIGADKAEALGEGGRFFEIRRVVSDLGVFVLRGGRLSIYSLHPGVELSEVVGKTGFELDIPEQIPTTREPTGAELAAMRG